MKDDMALIGTTDIPYEGSAEDVAITETKSTICLPRSIAICERTRAQRHRFELFRRPAAL